MKKQYIGEIEYLEKVSVDSYKMKIKSELDNIVAGQFISILCPPKTLRRPFSCADFDKEKRILTIIFKLKGDGTNYLKNLKTGDKVNFLAPLGNSFKIENKNSLLVGAGIGIAPMLFLKKELEEKNIENYLVTGFKKEEEIIKGSDENVIGGSVLDNIENIIKEKNIKKVYSCGPLIVLRKLSELCKKLDIDCQIAMERVMACSVGVCRGCVIQVLKNNEIVNMAVCKDGPVFNGSEIVWD